MALRLHDLRLFRRKDGKSVSIGTNPDLQLDAVYREVKNYLLALPGQAETQPDGTVTVPVPTPEGLEAWLQTAFPGAGAASLTDTEYYSYIDPITGMRVKVCIGDEIVVTAQAPASGGNTVPVDPPIVISFQESMT